MKINKFCLITLTSIISFSGLAQTVFTDNFNSYSDGSLNGQGGWAGNSNWVVEGNDVFEGAKAVADLTVHSNSNHFIYKQGSNFTDGSFTFYFKVKNIGDYYNPGLDEGGINDENRRIYLMIYNGNFSYYSRISGWHTIGTYNADTWYYVISEWRSSDHTARYSFNGGAFTNWDDTYGSWTYINKFHNDAWIINTGGGIIFDYIVENLLTAPTITSPTATSINCNSSTFGANITSDGGAAITARGICWGTSANPTTNCVDEGGTTTGVYTQSRTGLPISTYIYYRGYATNSVGTSYSTDGTFTSLSPTLATVNWNNSNVQEIILSTCRTFTFTNGKSGGTYSIIIKQDDIGGRTIEWPSNVKWAGSATPTFTLTPNAIDLVKFIYDGTNYIGIVN